MEGLSQKIHVITLVITRQKDVPLVRTKAKLLARVSGFARIRQVQMALMASEVARFLLRHVGGGRAIFHFVCHEGNIGSGKWVAGVMASFLGKRPLSERDLSDQDQMVFHRLVSAVEAVSDETSVRFRGEQGGLELDVIFLGAQKGCEVLLEQQEEIRKQLFRDIEESYLENLRAKHEEVLSLLKTVSLKNKELDKVNAELLELSRDMESLVHERTIVEFALRIADKIRNPATVIGGLSRLLLKKMPEKGPEREKVRAIYLEAKKLEAIVRDFEGLAREQERFFTKVVLQDLVREILEAWQPNLEKRGVALAFDAPDEPLQIKGNPRTLKVAILHILKNAMDASPKGSKLTVRIVRKDGRPTLEITDQGPGIETEIKSRLFKELVTTKPSGTGVGLIMVHHIMKEHQGDIKIESSPGRGTTVSLIFPERWKEKGS